MAATEAGGSSQTRPELVFATTHWSVVLMAGAPLVPNAPHGLCPACLMKVAMATGIAGGDESQRFTLPGAEEFFGFD
jgi:hypothetical protein